MSVCLSILIFADYTITACNIACLQHELLVSAKKQGMLYAPADEKKKE